MPSNTLNTDDLIKALRAPFPYASLLWSIGARSGDKRRGKAFPRLDTRDVQDRLDEVVGPDKWRTTYRPGPAAGGVFCTLELFINGRWVAKTDIGYQAPRGSDAVQNAGRALEASLKTTASDAFNRAAVLWGIGRYLYRFEPPYVELTNEGRHFALFPQVPDEFLPENERGQRPWEKMQEALTQGVSIASRKGVSLPYKTSARPSNAKAGTVSRITRPVRPVIDSALIGTAEQWQSLNVEERREIAVLHRRITANTDVEAVKTFLDGPRGEAMPDWAREALKSLLAPHAEPQPATETSQPAEGAAAETLADETPEASAEHAEAQEPGTEGLAFTAEEAHEHSPSQEQSGESSSGEPEAHQAA